MTVHYESERVTVHHGDCLDVLRELPDASVDAVVTDPPYGLEFMGREWDAPWKSGDGFRRSRNPADAGRDDPFGRASRTSPEYRAGIGFQAWCEQWAAECLRVLKPGGHMLAFGGTRTWHRLACAIEDAGFEIRDNLAWLYGSGFPKSLDVSKAIDKAAGAEREVVGDKLNLPGYHLSGHDSGTGALGRGISATTPETRLAAATITAPATPDAARWQGWGTALKPAYEPIVLARKPLAGTVAANVLAHGTGALNVDGCRVRFQSDADERESKDKNRHADFGTEAGGNQVYGDYTMVQPRNYNPPGRWPANVVLDEAAAVMLDEQSGTSQSRIGKPRGADPGDGWGMTATGSEYDDLDGASRFFYTAKAGSDERPRDGTTAHPTVKPLNLMRWLVRLVTPPGGTVLEPFAGSGTTVEACLLEGFRCVAVEREADYLPLILQRIHRRVDPVAHHAATRADDHEPSLFDLLGGDVA